MLFCEKMIERDMKYDYERDKNLECCFGDLPVMLCFSHTGVFCFAISLISEVKSINVLIEE